MAIDEGSKTPPFQLFQQPSKQAEPLPSEKAKQPPPLFQQPPVFKKTPTPLPVSPPPPAPVNPPPAQVVTPRPRTDYATIKPARTFNGLTPRGKKILWISAGVLAVSIAVYFLITFLLKKSDSPAAALMEKTGTASAPKPTVALPPAKPTKGMVQTETGSNVNLRESTSESSKSIILIPPGAEVMILRYGEEVELRGEKGRWCRVAYRAQIGWVWGKFIKEKK